MRHYNCFLFFILLSLGISAGVVHAQSTLTISMSTTPACNLDGTVTAMVAGGLPPYTYQWYTSQGFQTTTTTNTLAGMPACYVYVAVHDAGSGFNDAGVVIPGPFQIGATTTDEACGDGTGSATGMVFSGGTAPFTYSWSNGMTGATITGLHAGYYELSVSDANGCVVDSGLVTHVADGTPITGTIGNTPSACNDGTLFVSGLGGGTPPYAYVWGTSPVQTTPVATNLPANSFAWVTVTDAVGCAWIDYDFVPPAPNSLSLSWSQTDETCLQSDGSATVQPSGGTAPYAYLWANGATTQTATGLSYGNYQVTVTDANNCPMTTTAFVNRGDPLALSMSPTPPSCANAGGSLSVSVIGGAAPYTYLWNTGATTATITSLSAGYYSVTVTDANGCYDHIYGQLEMPQGCYATISGSIIGDANNNCVHDGADFPFPNRWVSTGTGYAYSDYLGNYTAQVFPGTYVVSQTAVHPYFAQACPSGPATYTVSLAAQQLVSGRDFYNVASTSVNDLSVTIYAEPARPTAPQHVWLYYSNDGSATQNATIHFVHDALMSLVSGSGQMTGYNLGTRTLLFDLGALQPFQQGVLEMSFSIPTSTQLGTPYSQYVEILPIAGDATPANNQVTLPGTVVSSFDPNAKSVYPDGQISVNDSVLTYTVQFQNTGNDTAFTVAISDTIDPSLEFASLEILGASHYYTVDATAPNVVHFRFPNIMLPDSNINEPLSHGHILYRIHLKPNLPIGTQIHNTAGIYFDYNAPVITNTTLNTLAAVGAPDPASETAFTLYPNPARGQVSLRLADNWAGQVDVALRDLSGRLLLQQKMHPDEGREVQLDLQGLSAGVYLVECAAKGQRTVRKLVLQ